MANNIPKKKLSLNPPTPSNEDQAIEKFINDAENHTKTAPRAEQQSTERLPWEVERGNSKQMKSLRLGIHEEYLLKLKYLSEHSDIPQQKIARAVLYPAIDAYLEQLKTQGYIKL